MSLESQIRPNVVGWFAIRHKDGWWACYQDHTLAKAALTIVFRREGRHSGPFLFRIETFTGATQKAGKYTPKLSAKQALEGY